MLVAYCNLSNLEYFQCAWRDALRDLFNSYMRMQHSDPKLHVHVHCMAQSWATWSGIQYKNKGKKNIINWLTCNLGITFHLEVLLFCLSDLKFDLLQTEKWQAPADYKL